MIDLETDLDSLLPSWDAVERFLPSLEVEIETRPPTRRRDRPFFESICQTYGKPGDASCADELLHADRELSRLAPDKAAGAWARKLRQLGMNPDQEVKPGVVAGSPVVPTGTETWGPQKWKELEAWADSVPCPPCRDFAKVAASGIHDVVNVHLGKPVFNADNFRKFVDAVKGAASRVTT